MVHTEENIDQVWCSISSYGITWKKNASKMVEFFWETRKQEEPRRSYLNDPVAGFIKGKFRSSIIVASDLAPIKKQKAFSDYEKVKKAFYNLVKVLVHEKSNILEDELLIKAIWKLAEQRKYWKRNVSYWKRKSKNSEKDFINLLIYLFDKYKDIPMFLHKEWYREAGNPPEIYFHLSEGKNIKTFNGFPIEMTRKMKNTFLQAPPAYNYKEAVVWSDIVTLGGNSHLAKNIFNTPITNNIANLERYKFWRTVIKFFAEAQMFDYVHVGPIIDYINSQKYRNDNTGTPPHPNMSMQGRDIAGLLKNTEEWHEELAKQHREVGRFAGKREIPKSWPGFGVKDYEVVKGSKKEPVRWIIKEITTATELSMEGREMGHCVGSYAWSCSSGKLSIFGLRRVPKSGAEKRVVTIEVSSAGSVDQARGKANKRPEKDESDFIKKWATEKGYKLSKWSGI